MPPNTYRRSYGRPLRNQWFFLMAGPTSKSLPYIERGGMPGRTHPSEIGIGGWSQAIASLQYPAETGGSSPHSLPESLEERWEPDTGVSELPLTASSVVYWTVQTLDRLLGRAAPFRPGP